MWQFKWSAILIGLICCTNVIAERYEGQLEVFIFDNFKKDQSKILYQLNKDGVIHRLNFPKSQDKSKFFFGQSITIDGQEMNGYKEKIIQVESISFNKKNSFVSHNFASGSRNVLPLIINFSNMKTTDTITVTEVDKILYTDRRSMRKNYQLSSFNELDFLRDTDNNGEPDIFVINLPYDAQGCNYVQWANDAQIAAAQEGINLSLYQHYMFILPQNVGCWWDGMGSLGCDSTCSTWVKGFDPQYNYSKNVYAHEIGHNLGMNHSATDLNNDGQSDSEYGDAACVMGTADRLYLKEINAPHRDQMHWFDPYSNLITNGVTGRYSIYSLESGTSAPGLLVVKIKKNDMETYYFSYRKAKGPFKEGAPTYLDKVSVHRIKEGDTHTYFIKTLSASESFVDENAHIKVTAITTGGNKAIIDVNHWDAKT